MESLVVENVQLLSVVVVGEEPVDVIGLVVEVLIGLRELLGKELLDLPGHPWNLLTWINVSWWHTRHW
eukprot:12926606-Prorocentrum_lima.AAC.1